MTQPSITFWGAARTVTGSKHLLEWNCKKVLVDCGLFQGSDELRDLNEEPFRFDPKEIDAVILTHAHTDHIGLLPKLINEGFSGKIYATPATLGICRISLPDSARLQEEDARHKIKHGADPTTTKPLYTEEDAYRTLKMIEPIKYFQMQSIPGGAQFRFIPAGHIFGSAFAEVYLEGGERILMGGDLGRYDAPLIKDPAPVEFTDYLVIESTYGDRVHAQEDAAEILAEVFQDAFQNQRCVLIPSFAIGRTQELLYYVNLLQRQGRMPRLPIFIDSPMATKATELYSTSFDDFDKDMKMQIDEGDEPLNPENVFLVRDRNDSKALNSRTGPMAIISGSGMCNGGRIVHHLKMRLGDPSTVVLFTGYQAGNTLGRRILEGEPVVKLMGEEIEVRAEVRKLNSLSAHADSNEMMRWLGQFKAAPKKTFIVHGEPPAQEALAQRIRAELGWEVEIPDYGQRFELP